MAQAKLLLPGKHNPSKSQLKKFVWIVEARHVLAHCSTRHVYGAHTHTHENNSDADRGVSVPVVLAFVILSTLQVTPITTLNTGNVFFFFWRGRGGGGGWGKGS